MNDFLKNITGIIDNSIKDQIKGISKSQLKSNVLKISTNAYDELDERNNFNHYIDFTVKNLLLPILVGLSIDFFYQKA